MASDLREARIGGRIDHAASNKDVGDLKEAAHSLKGAARSACINELGEAAAQLQTEAEGGRIVEETIARVIKEFTRAEDEINRL